MAEAEASATDGEEDGKLRDSSEKLRDSSENDGEIQKHGLFYLLVHLLVMT